MFSLNRNSAVLRKLSIFLVLAGCAPAPRQYSGQSRLEELTVEPGQTLSAEAQECSLTVKGPFQCLVLRGNENYFKLTGAVDRLDIDGRGNTIDCVAVPGRVRLRGGSNQVRMPISARRPEMDVEGTDQHVQFQTPQPHP